MNTIEIIKRCRSGVVGIAVERNREVLGNGSAFLVEGGLITNSHVIRPQGQINAIQIRFDDCADVIRLSPKEFYAATVAESPENQFDYAYIKLDEPEFENRHRFELGALAHIDIGSSILFLGFPFGMPQLTAHHGYVSSIHKRDNRDLIQIDGSVNGGNSGGPLIEIETGRVVGIITRAVTGIIEVEFNNLIASLRQNQEILKNTQVGIQVGGIDPIQGIRVSQAAMEQIAISLKRSANVGIGYAFSIDQVAAHIADT